MTGDADTLFAVGRIVKAFGIRGEIVVEPLTRDAERLRKLTQALVGRTADDARLCTITGVSIDGRGARLKLAEVPDRTAAEGLTGCYLFVGADERIRPAAGTFFVDEVVGLAVLDDGDRRIGTVKAVLHLPAHDVYVVAAGEREIMIPAVKAFILRIDPAAGVMQVRLIEGMLE